MKPLPRSLTVLSTFLVVACSSLSSQRVPFPPQDVVVSRPDVTRIYFVREDPSVLQKREIKVFDNETEIGALTTGTYLCWERPGGRTVGRAFYQSAEPMRGRIEGIADLNCEAGRAYYFNVTVGREEGKPTVTPLDPEEGRRLVAARKPAAES